MAGYCPAFPSWPRDTRSGLSVDSDIQVLDVEFSQHPRAGARHAAGPTSCTLAKDTRPVRCRRRTRTSSQRFHFSLLT